MTAALLCKVGYCCVKIKDTEQVVIDDGECSLMPIRENVLRL